MSVEAKSKKYDAVLIGAGGAGMCLLYAWSLRNVLRDKRILVLEPEIKDKNDRTWCFWAKDADEITRHIGDWAAHSWTKIQVGPYKQTLAPYRYYMIRSADLYAKVQNMVARYPGVEWKRERVATLNKETDGAVQILTQEGAYYADWVFDSRFSESQLAALSAPETLWQSFYGLRIRTLQNAFDPQTIRLMDFDTDQDDATQFVYVLPQSDCEALVELTRFGVGRLNDERGKELISTWLRQKSIETWEVIETERNAIPMSRALDPIRSRHAPEERIIPIGTAGGAMKSSSGYAFRNMFAHAMRIAEAWPNDPIPTPDRPQRFGFYDDLLLHILRTQPEQGKRIFSGLFERVSGARILEFLDEASTPLREASILKALPFRLFAGTWLKLWLQAWGKRARWERFLSGGGLAVCLLLCVLALQTYSPGALGFAEPLFLLIGMLFPGIPHGAADHCLGPAGELRGGALLRFALAYVGAIALILLLWLWSAEVGLLAFLAYSAWHFGETDLREWGIYRPAAAWLYGAGLLLLLLTGHADETAAYFEALGAGALNVYWTAWSMPLAITGAIAMTVGGFRVLVQARVSGWATFIILAGGLLLPLISAFALYFIGVHSLRGWMHLQSGLNAGVRKLALKALPFSAGAYALFVALWIGHQYAELQLEGLVPLFFIFLAALSAPHIWLMHRFYARSR